MVEWIEVQSTDSAPGSKTTWKQYLHLTNQQKDVWHMLYQALDRGTELHGTNFGACLPASTPLNRNFLIAKSITALTIMGVSIAFTAWLLIRKGYWSD